MTLLDLAVIFGPIAVLVFGPKLSLALRNRRQRLAYWQSETAQRALLSAKEASRAK